MVGGGGQAGGLGLEMGSSSNHFLLLSPSTLGSATADLVLLPEREQMLRSQGTGLPGYQGRALLSPLNSGLTLGTPGTWPEPRRPRLFQMLQGLGAPSEEWIEVSRQLCALRVSGVKQPLAPPSLKPLKPPGSTEDIALL